MLLKDAEKPHLRLSSQSLERTADNEVDSPRPSPLTPNSFGRPGETDTFSFLARPVMFAVLHME